MPVPAWAYNIDMRYAVRNPKRVYEERITFTTTGQTTTGRYAGRAGATSGDLTVVSCEPHPAPGNKPGRVVITLWWKDDAQHGGASGCLILDCWPEQDANGATVARARGAWTWDKPLDDWTWGGESSADQW